MSNSGAITITARTLDLAANEADRQSAGEG